MATTMMTPIMAAGNAKPDPWFSPWGVVPGTSYQLPFMGCHGHVLLEC